MKKIILPVVILVLIGITLGVYFVNKPHRNIAEEVPTVDLEATQLLHNFQENYDSTWVELRDQTITVSGVVSEVSASAKSRYIAFEVEADFGGVIGYLDTNLTEVNVQPGDKIQLKGKVNGYDPDLFQEVELKECVIESAL